MRISINTYLDNYPSRTIMLICCIDFSNNSLFSPIFRARFCAYNFYLYFILFYLYLYLYLDLIYKIYKRNLIKFSQLINFMLILI